MVQTVLSLAVIVLSMALLAARGKLATQMLASHEEEQPEEDTTKLLESSRRDLDRSIFLYEITNSMYENPEEWVLSGMVIKCGKIGVWVSNKETCRILYPFEIDLMDDEKDQIWDGVMFIMRIEIRNLLKGEGKDTPLLKSKLGEPEAQEKD